MGSTGNNLSYTIKYAYGGEYKTDKITKELFDAEKEAKLYLYDTQKDILNIVKPFYEKYQDGIANKDTFFGNTIAEWDETKRPKRAPDYVSHTKDGKVSSEYWFTKDGVIRGSNHWGDVASCDWFLKGYNVNSSHMGKKYGKCDFKDFVLKTQIDVNKEKGVARITTFNNIKNVEKKKGGMVSLHTWDW